MEAVMSAALEMEPCEAWQILQGRQGQAFEKGWIAAHDFFEARLGAYETALSRIEEEGNPQAKAIARSVLPDLPRGQGQ